MYDWILCRSIFIAILVRFRWITYILTRDNTFSCIFWLDYLLLYTSQISWPTFTFLYIQRLKIILYPNIRKTRNIFEFQFNPMSGFLVDYNSTLFMCSLYITLGKYISMFFCFIKYLNLGIISTFLSSLNLLIFFSNSEFRRKFVFFAAVDFGDLVDGNKLIYY